MITDGIVIDATQKSGTVVLYAGSGMEYSRTRSDDKARARTEKCSERYVPMVPP